MKTANLKYRLASWGLVFAILPSIIGINIFQHHCMSCNESELIATIASVSHEHEHDDCGSCHPEKGEKSCCNSQSESSEKDKCCTEEYRRVEVEANVASPQFVFKAAQVELIGLCKELIVPTDDLFLQSKRYFTNTVLKIPDEPSLEENCVFLL